MKNDRIPVTIITGFLGSGKTTLLNQLIKKYPEKKFAIIENEFGEVNIDSNLVIGVEDGIFELSNGCVCCSLNNEMRDTLKKITSQHPHINHLIVETTGIADPGPVANSFLADIDIQTTYRLDAIIALADVQFIAQQLTDFPEAKKQIAMADFVLLNKIDKVDDQTINSGIDKIAAINPNIAIENCSFGKGFKADLLNLQAFSAHAVLKYNFIPQSLKPSNTRLLSNKSKKTITPTHSDISSHSIIIDKPIDIIKFDTWMNLMLNFNAKYFYRIKGILNIEGFDQKLIFQAVNNQFVSESGGIWQTEEKRQTKMVFIGKYLNQELLENGLKQCCFNTDITAPEKFYQSILDFQEQLFMHHKEDIKSQNPN